MTEARIVETADGPAVQILAGGPALRLYGALGRLLALRPDDVPNDPVIGPLRRSLKGVELERDRRIKVGEPVAAFTPESTSGDLSHDGYASPKEAGFRLGRTPQTITTWCRLGRIPGSEQIDGRWRIPWAALPEEEDLRHAS